LVVDDEEYLRETLAEFLTEQGYSVQTAPDGLAAKKILLTQKINLVLTDIRMPNMNGIDLLKFSMALPEAPKVIVITGFSDYSKEQIEGFGASAMLNKPFDLEKLLGTVKSLLPH
jgi:DNA-binding response OmpR family regulator